MRSELTKILLRDYPVYFEKNYWLPSTKSRYLGKEFRKKRQMDIKIKLAVLDRIYRIYDDFSGGLDMACKKYCAECCTPNVTMTTLEACLIANHIISNGQSDLFENVQATRSEKRFKPRTTTNRLADLCRKGDDPPEEAHHYFNRSCPLLTDNLCPIYPVRPFGCRCFVSKHDCRKEGYSEVDPFVITANTLFLQFVEHVDAMGFSGNFTDVLLLLASKENRDHYKINTLKRAGAGFIPNLQITVLMIPPEHRIKIKPLLDALMRIKGQ